MSAETGNYKTGARGDSQVEETITPDTPEMKWFIRTGRVNQFKWLITLNYEPVDPDHIELGPTVTPREGFNTEQETNYYVPNDE